MECVILRRWAPALPQLGRKNSLRDLLSKLRQAGIVNVRTAEFFQVRACLPAYLPACLPA
jgi:hypothetical protein